MDAYRSSGAKVGDPQRIRIGAEPGGETIDIGGALARAAVIRQQRDLMSVLQRDPGAAVPHRQPR